MDQDTPPTDATAVASVVDTVDDEPPPEAPFVLQLASFEGPLDLLLHLLDQHELEITEVSLLAVTEQYLSFLHDAERLNIDALAEFISVGARLLLLKSRALLPRDPDAPPPAIDDEDDPANLVRALQEYRRFKQVAGHLQALESEHRTGYRRSVPPPNLPLPPGLEGVTLTTLVDLVRQVLSRVPPERPTRAIPRARVRLADRITALMERLDHEGRTSFLSLLGDEPTRISVIVEFLAVLELIKVRYLAAEQSEAFGDIDLVRVAEAETVGPVELEITE